MLPEQSPYWQHLESVITGILRRYGYREIRFPILESTDLFKRSIGEVTDIVEKEMYTFEDRNGDSLTLRPEGTASCVRACEQHGLLYNQTQRLWYQGPMFRHERPQKGRYRQFHQIGVEVFGLEGPDVDAELLLLSARILRELGLADRVHLELNSLGSTEARTRYREALVAYLEPHREQLDPDSQRRLGTNPLRILDSKVSTTQDILRDAPVLTDYLDEASQAHFEQLRALLDANDVAYSVNPRLVRGLDYYGKTAFEWITDQLGAQGTVCAGGRYDGLVEQLGGKPTPAIGFGIGLERLVLMLQAAEAVPEGLEQQAQIYLAAVGNVNTQALQLAERIRDALPGVSLLTNCGGGSFKSQLKRADKSQAQVALILGEDEARGDTVTVKMLRDDTPQQTLPTLEAIDYLRTALSHD